MNEIPEAREWRCEGCDRIVADLGGDEMLGWVADADGYWFCDRCVPGESLTPPPPKIMERLRAAAAQQAYFKRLLHEHREGALTCYDHPDHYCCVCGEHMALGYHEHLAAILASHERARDAAVRERVAQQIEAAAAAVLHGHQMPMFIDAARIAREPPVPP